MRPWIERDDFGLVEPRWIGWDGDRRFNVESGFVGRSLSIHGDGKSTIDRVVDSTVVLVRKARAAEITAVDETSQQSYLKETCQISWNRLNDGETTCRGERKSTVM